MKRSPKLKKILAILKTFNDEFTAKDVAEAYNKHHFPLQATDITPVIVTLCSKGKIDRIKRGLYKMNKFGYNFEY